jgi:hypothetical protein
MSIRPSSKHSNTSTDQQLSGTPVLSAGSNQRARAWLQNASKARSESPVAGTWKSEILVETEINGDEDYDALIEYLNGYIPPAEVEAEFDIFRISDLARALSKAVEEIQSLESEIRTVVLEAQHPDLELEVDNDTVLGSQGNVWKVVTSEYIGRANRDRKCECLKSARQNIKYLRGEVLELQRLVFARYV